MNRLLSMMGLFINHNEKTEEMKSYNKGKLKMIMKQLQNLSLALLSTSALLSADITERMELAFVSNGDGGATPQLFVPVYWEDGALYSAVGYDSGSSMKVSDNGTDKTLTASNQYHLWMNIINYQTTQPKGFNYSIGFVLDYKNIRTNEFGTLTYSGINKVENSVKLDTYSAAINLEISYKNIADMLSLRLGTYITPYTYLSVDQKTSYDPLISGEGMSTSSKPQDIEYTLMFDAYLQTGMYVDISLNATYKHLPLTYDVAAPSHDGTNFVFEDLEYKTIDNTVQVSLKLVFPEINIAGMKPMLGYSYINYNSTLNGSDLDYEDENRYVFGFENKF